MRLAHVVTGALLVAAPAVAEDHCTLNAVIGGKKAAMTSCAAAVMDNAGLTLFFSATPIAADERSTFEMNSYAKDTNPDGSARTMLYFAFCPGGGKPEANAAAVKSVEMGINHASSVLLSRQWVFEVPGDAALKIEKLEGTLAAGGRISGHITGGKTSDGLAYSWDAEFDVAVPETNALAGPGCGS
jgi:hypothetical protein